MAGSKAKRAKAKRAKPKSKVSSKKAHKSRASRSAKASRASSSKRSSADGALRAELGSARAAIKERERQVRDLASVMKVLGAPKGNGAAQRSYAARVRKEAALAQTLKKQLDSLKGQHKTSTARLLSDVAKLKKVEAAAKSQSSKSAAKFKFFQSQLAERDKRIKVLRAGAKQAESLQKSVASLEKQRTAAAQRSKQQQDKIGERAAKLFESLQLLKKEVAAKSKQAREGGRAVLQSQKLAAQLGVVKEAQKKYVEQLKATEQRAKEAEKKLDVFEKKAKALEEKRNTPMVLAQASNRLQFKPPLTPAPKKLFDAAKTRIKTAEEKLKITPPAAPAKPKRTENVDDELPFDEEDFEEEVELDEEEEEETAEGGEEGEKETKPKPKKKAPPPDGDDDEPPPSDDDS